MELEAKYDKLKDELNTLKSRLDGHLQVANVVDGNTKDKVEDLKKDFETLSKEFYKVRDYVNAQKAQKNSSNAGWGYFFKFTAFLGLVLGVLITLFKGIMYLSSKIQWNSP